MPFLPIQSKTLTGDRFMKPLWVLFFVLLAALQPAAAATLYRWTDASGTPRYGYQPPPGVEAVPAEAERRDLYENAPPVACRDLAEQHLKLIDTEIARIKAMPAGLGPDYEFSPAAKQELILDLLAHRAAVLTGRKAAEFRTPTLEELEQMKSRLQSENAKMRDELSSREAIIDAQKNRLERTRREADYARHMYRPLGPAPYAWPPGAVPYPAGR
jgi:hypothetical protein